MLSKLKIYIGATFGIIALIIGAFLKGKNAGKETEKAKQNEEFIKNVKKGNDARNDDSNDDKLYDEYCRD